MVLDTEQYGTKRASALHIAMSVGFLLRPSDDEQIPMSAARP